MQVLCIVISSTLLFLALNGLSVTSSFKSPVDFNGNVKEAAAASFLFSRPTITQTKKP